MLTETKKWHKSEIRNFIILLNNVERDPPPEYALFILSESDVD